MNYDRKALKLEAKALVREARPRAWVVTLVFILLAAVLPQVVEGILNPVREMIPQIMEEIAQMVGQGQEPSQFWALSVSGRAAQSGMIATFASVLLSLFAIVIDYGYRNYALRLFRRQAAGVGTVFSAFPLAGRAIGTQLMTLIFAFLWMLLAYFVAMLVLVLGVWLLSAVEWLAIAWMVGVVLAATVVFILIALRYCLAPYFVMSEPGMGVFDAITASKRAMRGNYIKKFALDLSFLGWGLLIFLIVYLVTAIGSAVVMLTAGGDWLLNLERASHMTMTDEQSLAFVMGSLAELLERIVLPMGVVLCVAWLVTLPLTLWLKAYQSVSEAGFFLIVTGQAVWAGDEPNAGYVPDDPAPVLPDQPRLEALPVAPAPPVVEAPQEPQSAEPPQGAPAAEAPQESFVAEAPQEPQVEETTQEPWFKSFQAGRPQAGEGPEESQTPEE